MKLTMQRMMPEACGLSDRRGDVKAGDTHAKSPPKCGKRPPRRLALIRVYMGFDDPVNAIKYTKVHAKPKVL